MRRLSHPVIGAALVALALAGVFVAARSNTGAGPLEVLERWSLDWRLRLRGPVAPSPDLALVVFDDATAERAGPLFERRAGWAKVIRAVHAAGAKVIGVDAAFPTPERLLGEDLQARVVAWRAAHPQLAPTSEDAALLADVSRELDGDGQLVAAMREAGDVVLILFAGAGGGVSRSDDSGLSRARYAQSTPAEPPPEEVSSFVASIPSITAAAKAMGFASVSEDETRTVRRLGFARTWHGGTYYPFTVAVVATWLEINRGRLAWLGPQGEARLGDRTLALDHGALWLNPRGPAETFPTYPAIDLLEGKLKPGALAGKIVLLGVTRLGYDVTRTPFGSTPGVEVQATAIDNVLRGDSLRRTTRVQDGLLTFGLGLLVALLFALRSLRPVQQLVGLGLLLGGWLGASFYALSHSSVWLPCVGPGFAALACGVTGLGLSYASEALQRRQLKKAFGHYLGEEALDELLAHPEMLELGGERRALTVLFSDIRDFTTLAEGLPPDRLVAFLNTYLSPMTRAVLGIGGLLDKYIGDAVMAVFGAPLRREDHARQALACVLEMHRELELLNAGPLKEMGLHIAIGVGVNTGDMVVGNMGSAERFDYTVAGDAVNLASRLEGLTKTYGVFCLVGETARAAAGPGFAFRAVDLVQVKGKHEAVAVHELLAGPGRSVRTLECLEDWASGIDAWREGKLPQARIAFARFAAANPADVAAQRYLERLAALPEQAPLGFSPVTVFTTK